MSSPEVIYACRVLIRDTFRQAIANGVFWVLLGSNSLVILFCLSISVEHGEVRPPDDIEIDRPTGHMSVAFGAWRLPKGSDGQDTVHLIFMGLGEGVFGIVGTLLALVLTAGFVPEFLQASNATVLLSKPTPRWVLLLGKYLGVMALLAFHVGLFVFGTWLALGLRTDIWVNRYLWGAPLLLLQAASVYSFSVFLAVCTGSTLVCAVGSILFWGMCWGMNIGRHMVVSLESDLPRQHFVLRFLTDVGYWILPKPFDLNMILHAAVESGQSMPQLQSFQQLGTSHPELSILTSLAFAVGMLALSAYQLASKDY